MSEHSFQPSGFSNHLRALEPVLTVDPGDRVFTRTVDAHGLDQELRKVAEKDNPLTGPFAVRGAEPGDLLAVHLEAVTPNRDRGWSICTLAPGMVDPAAVRDLPPKVYGEWEVDRGAGVLRYLGPLQAPEVLGRGNLGRDDPPRDDPFRPGFSRPEGAPAAPPPELRVPLDPFVGTLGMAPPQGQAILATTSGSWGGNMDYRGLRAGVTVWFPVYAPGGLLFVGDGHAAQSDGELAGSGVEISLDLTFSVDLVRGEEACWPRGEDRCCIFTVGNARPLSQALQHATTEMLRWLQASYGLGRDHACILIGQGAEYHLGNVFDPAYTMVCRMRKELLPGSGS
jgi:acetamidase/formamidase